jgi:hypothetical protein
MTRLPTKEMALMRKIDKHLMDKSECSMGEIYEELEIPIWKQYVLYRAYQDYFPAIKLKGGRWSWDYKQLGQPVPASSQDTLTGKG